MAQTQSSTTTKTCPVCNEEFTGSGQEVRVEGNTLNVCSSECAAEARDDPTKFAKGSPQR